MLITAFVHNLIYILLLRFKDLDLPLEPHYVRSRRLGGSCGCFITLPLASQVLNYEKRPVRQDSMGTR